jgi:glucose/arabinose dehydrogenase
MKHLLLFAGLFICLQHNLAQPVVQLQSFATGFVRPVDITHAGDERLFVVEQRGMIHVLDAQGQRLPTPFLDIRSRVNSSASERGLLGLAFHPNYAQNGYFYVNYTNLSGHTRIARFQVSAGNANVANPDSELIIMGVNQPYSNHNAGDLNFGPDGYLYFGLGDGGSGGDPQNYSQNRQSLLGKMIRIDVNNGSPYAIPADNPFINDAATLNEIWAIGLRNPWKFSFDRLTGDMWIGDVGQNAWEEIDFQPAGSPGGQNYGWRCYEGNNSYNTGGCQSAPNYVAPVHSYANNFSNGCSVTGGIVYRGSAYPDLYGHYVYADYCSGRIWSLFPNSSGAYSNRLLLQGAASNYVSFGEDHQGELYLCALSSGTIFRMRELCSSFRVSGNSANESCAGDNNGRIELTIDNPGATHTISWSNGANAVSLQGLGSGQYTVTVSNSNNCSRIVPFTISNGSPEVQAPLVVQGNALAAPMPEDFVSYQWLLNGQPISGATAATHTATATGAYSLRAVNAAGCAYTWPAVQVVVSSIALPGWVEYLRVSPNPAVDWFELSAQTSRQARLTFMLTDASGKISLTMQDDVSGSWRKRFERGDLPAGLYQLTVLSGAEVLTTIPLLLQGGR